MIRIQFDSYNFIGNVEFESRIGSLEIAGASKSAFASSQFDVDVEGIQAVGLVLKNGYDSAGFIVFRFIPPTRFENRNPGMV